MEAEVSMDKGMGEGGKGTLMATGYMEVSMVKEGKGELGKGMREGIMEESI